MVWKTLVRYNLIFYFPLLSKLLLLQYYYYWWFRESKLAESFSDAVTFLQSGGGGITAVFFLLHKYNFVPVPLRHLHRNYLRLTPLPKFSTQYPQELSPNISRSRTHIGTSTSPKRREMRTSSEAFSILELRWGRECFTINRQERNKTLR